ncbi:SAM-dependent methyltransferase [Mycobacterium sp. ACS1612]|uniref:cyclopropane mycolic acid synthase family methyltransferase n=1 Tax=Mycobacterium sp. ACS1612 TaxID=1834117 RepID=UPI000801CA29|nr:cyclopropane mycolic acid synthase family methyltransferase [Mycobacterium sp. ACS1612]OBF37823.1 SAM-dependent methyltransferase [Mycobacterium sp. ACS1612]
MQGSRPTPRTRGSNADDIQSHYDLSNEFFRLWQDANQVYSCAYFERDDMTLDEAQIAKIDLALGKLDLRPGMTLLDIGCGWGAAMMRAVEKYDVNVIGLTLSHNQMAHITDNLFAKSNSRRRMEVRLQSWEEWDGRVDRIVSIGAFEHFGFDKYEHFFRRTFDSLPDGGKMLLHTIVIPSDEEIEERQFTMTMSLLRFIKFIMDEIFPGGRLPQVQQVRDHATRAGFDVTRVQALRPHYARTLDIWAAKLEANRDEAIALTSDAVYQRYMKYLTGCADLFRTGRTDVCQFTCEKGSLTAG